MSQEVLAIVQQQAAEALTKLDAQDIVSTEHGVETHPYNPTARRKTRRFTGHFSERATTRD